MPPKRGARTGTIELVDTAAGYNNFLGALSRVVTTKGGWQGSWELIGEHDELIAVVRRVLQLGYERNAWNQALALWELHSDQIHGELSVAREVGVDPVQVDAAAKQLKWIRATVEGGAYHEARDKAMAGSTVQQPDLVQVEVRFKEAQKRLQQSQWFADKAKPLLADAAGMAGGASAGMGKAAYDVLAAPGSIKEKLEYAKKANLVLKTATAVDLLNLLLDTADNTVKVTATAVANVSRIRQAAAMRKGLVSEAKAYGKAAEKYTNLAGKLDKLGKAANVLAIVAEAIKIVDALGKSPVDWDTVLDSGLEIGLNAAELALGADGAPILAIAMVVRAEIEVLRMVSDQIKWAKRETARGAAADFVNVAAKIAKSQAFTFIADCELAVNGEQAAVREIAAKRVQLDGPRLARSLTVLHSHIARKSKDSVGGYPDMINALGADAMRIFNNPAPPTDALNVMQQCEVIFAATNLLARHVQDRYKD